MLDNIRVLVRAVELGSFSAAGRSMRLSAAVVSHRIRSLEKHLGCRLFNRTTRKMHLTDQGRVFYENSIEVLRALERAEASVADKGASPRGMIKVTAPLGFGRRVVAPVVPKFQKTHPEVDVVLRLSEHLIDLLSEAVDVAVRMAVLVDSSLVARKIADIDRVLVASPQYLARCGRPKSIGDLDKHSCLLLRYPGSQQVKWPLKKGTGFAPVAVSGHMDTDDGETLEAWALDGHGIVLKPVFEISDHLKSGALEAVLPEHPPMPVTLAILHAYQRMEPPKLRAFADLLVEDARAYIGKKLDGLAPAAGKVRRGRG